MENKKKQLPLQTQKKGERKEKIKVLKIIKVNSRGLVKTNNKQ